jgi:hypothetical protein
MGTNFYRVPKVDEVNSRFQKLNLRLQELDKWNPGDIERGYRFIDNPNDEWSRMNPWEELMEGMSVHLGKRSGGWKFCWNFHKNKYYSNKDELLKFIREGRVVDEYGTQIDCDEFIEMALEWCEDGWDNQTYYKENPSHHGTWIDYSTYNDDYIDGLRVSKSTKFF